jgi:hypothetical protein
MTQTPHASDPEGLSPDELASEVATDLPDREALSIVDPGVFSTLPVAHIGRAAAHTSSTTSEAPPDLGVE